MENSKEKWSFEYQWKNYDTKYLTYGLSEEEEFKKFCNDLMINHKDLKNKKILDAGCGSGRLTKHIAIFSKNVYGVDLIQLSKDKNVKFVKADIMALPFRNSFFDLVYSEGVLHHTPDPKKTFIELARVNKKKLFIMLYSKRNIFMFMRKYLLTYKYPYSILRTLSLFSACLVYLPINIIKKSMKIKRELSIRSLDFLIFDYLSPRYQSVHSFTEVEAWFKEAGYKKVHKISGNGTCVLGIK